MFDTPWPVLAGFLSPGAAPPGGFGLTGQAVASTSSLTSALSVSRFQSPQGAGSNEERETEAAARLSPGLLLDIMVTGEGR